MIQNTGATVIEVPNPELHHEWPIFRVVGSMADKVNDFKPARMWKKTGFVPIATDPSLGITQKLAPGDTLTFEFSLLDRLELPETGKYEITAVIDWKGKIFTSPPLYVTILQAIPVFSDYVYAHSGVSPLLYSAWSGGRSLVYKFLFDRMNPPGGQSQRGHLFRTFLTFFLQTNTFAGCWIRAWRKEQREKKAQGPKRMRIGRRTELRKQKRYAHLEGVISIH